MHPQCGRSVCGSDRSDRERLRLAHCGRRHEPRRTTRPDSIAGGSLPPKDVEEADRSVEEGMDGEQRPSAHAIAFAGVLQMLDHRLVADLQNARDLPVGLAAGGQ